MSPSVSAARGPRGGAGSSWPPRWSPRPRGSRPIAGRRPLGTGPRRSPAARSRRASPAVARGWPSSDLLLRVEQRSPRVVRVRLDHALRRLDEAHEDVALADREDHRAVDRGRVLDRREGDRRLAELDPLLAAHRVADVPGLRVRVVRPRVGAELLGLGRAQVAERNRHHFFSFGLATGTGLWGWPGT